LQKTKLALVSLLSLLVVVAPAASALAQTQNMEEAVETNEKEQSSQKSEARGGVFEEIEEKGAKPVSDKKLDEKKGEGAFGALAGAVVGGLAGLGTSIANGITSGHGPAKMAHDAFMSTAAGIGAGATIGGLSSTVF